MAFGCCKTKELMIYYSGNSHTEDGRTWFDQWVVTAKNRFCGGKNQRRT